MWYDVLPILPGMGNTNVPKSAGNTSIGLLRHMSDLVGSQPHGTGLRDASHCIQLPFTLMTVQRNAVVFHRHVSVGPRLGKRANRHTSFQPRISTGGWLDVSSLNSAVECEFPVPSVRCSQHGVLK